MELLDTFFIICKGNYRQLTFLHIYHHASVIAWWWIGAKVIHVLIYNFTNFLVAYPYWWTGMGKLLMKRNLITIGK